MDTDVQDLKKQRLHHTHGPSPSDPVSHDCCTAGGGEQPSSGFGSLPSKEAVASMGLEAKVDMATHGHKSWALTSLGAWRDRSMSGASGGGKSAAFIKSRQREARRAMLGGGAAAVVAAPSPAAGGAGADGLVADDMAVG